MDAGNGIRPGSGEELLRGRAEGLEMLDGRANGALVSMRGEDRVKGGGSLFSLIERYQGLRRQLKQGRKAKRQAKLLARGGVPTWFNPILPAELAEPRDRPCVVYDGNATGDARDLVAALDDARFDLVDLGLFSTVLDAKAWERAVGAVDANLPHFTALVLSKVARIKRRACLVLLTSDCEPLQRQIAVACSEVGMVTVLVPRGELPIDEETYYRHPATGIDKPVCDHVLCRGDRQRSIFVSRGFPEERVIITDAPWPREVVAQLARVDRPLRPYNAALAFIRGERRDVGTVGLINEGEIGRQRGHLAKLLGIRRTVIPRTGLEAAAVDVMFHWGLIPNANKARNRRMASLLLRPMLYVEDGFLRSIGIGLSGELGMCTIIDDKTLHYDARQPSRLEATLQSDEVMAEGDLERARRVIASIRRHRLSKYNHAPDRPDVPAAPDRRTVLLVDQRFGDASVEFGMASEESFRRMLDDALADPQARVIAKLHPDAIGGGKGSYLGPLVAERPDPRLIVIDYDLNPHALFDVVDDVWVATSGLGFEALMAGKRVRCYGVPYYSGWGVTADMTPCPRRTRPRTVEEIFAVAWLRMSRYMSPATGERGEIEDVVEHLAAALRARDASAVAHEPAPAA